VDVDQQQIGRALGEFVRDELAALPNLIAAAEARQLPVVGALEGYRQELSAIEREETQKRITFLAQEGLALKRRYEEVSRLRTGMTPENLERVSRAASVLANVWPALRQAAPSDDLEVAAGELQELLAAPDLFDRLHEMKSKSESIHAAYEAVLSDAHMRRNEVYEVAVDRVLGDERLPQLALNDREALLGPLQSRVCGTFTLELGETVCGSCQSSLQLIESEIAAVSQYEATARRRIAELTDREQRPTKVIRAADHFSVVETVEDVERGVDSLRDELLKSLDEGNRTIVE